MTHPKIDALPRPTATGSLVRERLRAFTEGVLTRPLYALYVRRLRVLSRNWTLPRHIGFIMDGNRRFARSAGMRSGHLKGAEKLREVLDWCFDLDIRLVTIWSFSLDNFERNADEVSLLLDLFEEKTRELVGDREVHRRQVRIRYLGRLELLPESLRAEIQRAEEATAAYGRYGLNIAMAYGGREEIADAVARYLERCRALGQSLEEAAQGFDESALGAHLYTSGQPEPDLILRTSGEVRLSGFLLWQSAYSEFYFSDTHWPAFREIDLLRALRSYDQRQRRFGR